ncbi:PREDICTED: uncharacterized protein LOC109220649 [Nicotiana attenuata]|uniref:uncharacterized protein LOC109220649 n=1 Tax=Nicotiana attenuata TaxID=49451 RepID=UPI000905D641|nr:PREDICTED: uncharacterized protein LOC109220649 [Nicotiana attenuata]
MRSIQHQIDVVPGAPLSNKAAYRMNPTRQEELQRQVKELLDRGLIRESLSPCVVPALLVPKKDGSWRMCVDSRVINKITVNKDDQQHLKHLRKIFEVLREQTLYAKLKKCKFFSEQVSFLSYIVSSEGIHADSGKIEVIASWPIPKSLTEIRSFHGMISFYRHFIKNFSSLVAPITECLKGNLFK